MSDFAMMTWLLIIGVGTAVMAVVAFRDRRWAWHFFFGAMAALNLGTFLGLMARS